MILNFCVLLVISKPWCNGLYLTNSHSSWWPLWKRKYMSKTFWSLYLRILFCNKPYWSNQDWLNTSQTFLFDLALSIFCLLHYSCHSIWIYHILHSPYWRHHYCFLDTFWLQFWTILQVYCLRNVLHAHLAHIAAVFDEKLKDWAHFKK